MEGAPQWQFCVASSLVTHTYTTPLPSLPGSLASSLSPAPWGPCWLAGDAAPTISSTHHIQHPPCGLGLWLKSDLVLVWLAAEMLWKRAEAIRSPLISATGSFQSHWTRPQSAVSSRLAVDVLGVETFFTWGALCSISGCS